MPKARRYPELPASAPAPLFFPFFLTSLRPAIFQPWRKLSDSIQTHHFPSHSRPLPPSTYLSLALALFLSATPGIGFGCMYVCTLRTSLPLLLRHHLLLPPPFGPLKSLSSCIRTKDRCLLDKNSPGREGARNDSTEWVRLSRRNVSRHKRKGELGSCLGSARS
jgi:hypothetical protein